MKRRVDRLLLQNRSIDWLICSARNKITMSTMCAFLMPKWHLTNNILKRRLNDWLMMRGSVCLAKDTLNCLHIWIKHSLCKSTIPTWSLSDGIPNSFDNYSDYFYVLKLCIYFNSNNLVHAPSHIPRCNWISPLWAPTISSTLIDFALASFNYGYSICIFSRISANCRNNSIIAEKPITLLTNLFM